MSRIDTLVCTDARKTKYRFVVLTMIFLVYAINYADRTNIGAVLPFIIDEFHINNFEAGAIASMFFLGYAVSQIPAGFFIAKRGTRGLVSLSIFGFSAFTSADGHGELGVWPEAGAAGTGAERRALPGGAGFHHK